MDDSAHVPSSSRKDKEKDKKKRHRISDIPFAQDTAEMQSYLELDSPDRSKVLKKPRHSRDSVRVEFRTVTVTSQRHETTGMRVPVSESPRPDSSKKF